jgi:hypothetical protein
MKKIYAFSNGGSPGWMQALAICEDGIVLAEHICSDVGFMPHDLGVNGNWKHENYDKHCGKGQWEIEWVPPEKIDTHEGIQAAFAANKALPPETPFACERAGATVVVQDETGKETELRTGF